MAETVVRSEIAGKVWSIDVRVGQQVAAEAPIVTLESMKMEIPVPAPMAGTVQKILVAEGDMVGEDQPVAVIDG